ncbi:MAG: hypothetical protein R3C28_19350 [Pirellulaceae bacterium]
MKTSTAAAGVGYWAAGGVSLAQALRPMNEFNSLPLVSAARGVVTGGCRQIGRYGSHV